MLELLTLWGLLCVSTRADVVELPAGSSSVGCGRGVESSAALSLRQLLVDPEPRIIGGESAPEGRFPYACSLRRVGSRDQHRCGATLIAPEWVLTAAHCLVGDDALGPTPIVYVGAYDLEDTSSAEVIRAVDVRVHPKYNDNDFKGGFDIALLKLGERSKRKPVEMAHADQIIGNGEPLVTAGWGALDSKGRLPKTLQYLDRILYVSNQVCKAHWKFLLDSMVCAIDHTAATCRGDSGGPLLIADSDERGRVKFGDPKYDLLVGIVSFGPPGCLPTRPDGFTRVSSFRPWIDEQIGSAPPRPSPPAPTTKQRRAEDDPERNGKLYNAAGLGESDTVKRLISEGANVASTHGEQNFTALHYGAAGGHADVVGTLLKEGVDVNVPNGESATPLYFAALNGHVDAAGVLLDEGAAVDSKTNMGVTPLMVATFIGDVEMVDFLVEADADVDAQNDEGVTALFLAAQEGHLAIAQLLIRAGAHVDLRPDNGATPLIVAAQRGHIDVSKLLLTSGANVNAQSNIGQTPLHKAAYGGHLTLFKLLIDNEAKANVRDNFQLTPAIYETLYGSSRGGQASRRDKAGGRGINGPGLNGGMSCKCLDSLSAQPEDG